MAYAPSVGRTTGSPIYPTDVGYVPPASGSTSGITGHPPSATGRPPGADQDSNYTGPLLAPPLPGQPPPTNFGRPFSDQDHNPVGPSGPPAPVPTNFGRPPGATPTWPSLDQDADQMGSVSPFGFGRPPGADQDVYQSGIMQGLQNPTTQDPLGGGVTLPPGIAPPAGFAPDPVRPGVWVNQEGHEWSFIDDSGMSPSGGKTPLPAGTGGTTSFPGYDLLGNTQVYGQYPPGERLLR